jgi:nuclear GTP-binding protein
MKRRGLSDATSEMEVADEANQDQLQIGNLKNQEVVSHALNATIQGSSENADGVDLEEDEKQENKNSNYGQNSRRAYLRELRKVVERSDVIINVLDARDPLGTKSNTVEEMVAQYSKKKLIFVLNKADLVPKEVLEGWLLYMRQFHPTIPFKCNTQHQKGNLGSTSGKVMSQSSEILQTSQSIGSEELLNLLKNYCRLDSTSTKTIITVGIVGFPNVGKSSLINSLMRIRAVGVSAMPGFTKSLQEVVLDKNIRLIDSPGVVFADGDNPNTALKNVVNIEDMTDVFTPVQAIIDRCPAAYLMQVYSIPKFHEQDCQHFLSLVAKANGKLKKGGIPNLDATARMVLHDWNSGKIKYYCKPPSNFLKNQSSVDIHNAVDLSNIASTHSSNKKSRNKTIKEETQLVTTPAAELDMNDLQARVIDQLHEENRHDLFVAMETINESLE